MKTPNAIELQLNIHLFIKINMNKKIQLAEVLNLTGIKKHCKQVIEHCEICNGIIIDDDNVPDEYIVDYNDRQIHSAKYTCIKCHKDICENCLVAIDGAWEKYYVCSECYEKYKKRINHILKLQKRLQGLSDEVDELIEDFLNE